LIVITIFVSFLIWQTVLAKRPVFGVKAPDLDTRDWLFLISLMTGITGWVCSAFISLRNSIKQHTVSIYVQSRLSSPYAETIKRVNLMHFSIGCTPDPIPTEIFASPDNAELMHDINTVLNYFEFIAVGIRHGDFDELVLKDIMHGMIINMCLKASLYIKFLRSGESGIGGVRSFEHLLWLEKRWEKL
jgi:hypothetical protein